MSTTSFSVTRDSVINSALRIAGVIGRGQTPTPADVSFAAEALNYMVKEWMTKGATLWKIQELTLPLVSGVRQYPLGETAGYVYSIPVTAGGAGYDGTSTITLSAPGTFSGFTGTTATASLGITGGAVTSVNIISGGGGYVGAPTVTLGGNGAGATFGTPVLAGLTTARPLRILDQGNFIRTISSSLDTPLTLLGRDEYEMYGAKSSLGVVNSFFYDPQLGNGNVFVYPTPQDSSRELHLFVQVTYNDFDTAATTPDFPQEWFSALKYGLARELVIEYGVDDSTAMRIENRYHEALNAGLNFSVEEASTFFTVDSRGR